MSQTTRKVIAIAEFDETTQLDLTRALADALIEEAEAEAILREKRAAVGAAFFPWAAGRSISRDEAREHLESTGYLPKRRNWE